MVNAEPITRVLDGETLLLGINRPERKNALTAAMYRSLADSLTYANAHDIIRVVLIHGTQEVFCAGNDIADFARQDAGEGGSPSAPFMRALIAMDKPVIAAVNGPAVGIGATMLLHCDLVFGGSAAQLSFPFTRLGVCPEFASSLLLAKTLGYQRAAELFFLGESVGSRAALEMGLFNAVHPPEEVMAQAQGVARRLCGMSQQSLRTTRRLIRPDKDVLLARVDQEAREFSALKNTPEAQAAFAAFLQRGRRLPEQPTQSP